MTKFTQLNDPKFGKFAALNGGNFEIIGGFGNFEISEFHSRKKCSKVSKVLIELHEA